MTKPPLKIAETPKSLPMSSDGAVQKLSACVLFCLFFGSSTTTLAGVWFLPYP